MVRKNPEEIRFEFAGYYHSETVPDQWGRVRCDICESRFKSAHVDVILYDFLICPACMQAGPKAMAAKLEQIARDKDLIARKWGYSDDPISYRQNVAGMVRAYRTLASALRRLHSFEELPGGKIALDEAEVSAKRKKKGSGVLDDRKRTAKRAARKAA